MCQFTATTGGAGRGLFLDTLKVARTNFRGQLLDDIDNDGDLDLLTSNRGSKITVAVRRLAAGSYMVRLVSDNGPPVVSRATVR